MSETIPNSNGQVVDFRDPSATPGLPRIYYVNGILTDGPTHANTAMYLSKLIEHEVHGVYNATTGAGVLGAVDFLQCIMDWGGGFAAKLAEIATLGVSRVVTDVVDKGRSVLGRPAGDPVSLAQSIREKVSPGHRLAFLETYFSMTNRATASLFHQLKIHLGQPQWVIAHSQGNMITANALWGMAVAFGEVSMANMKVYSLASPTPAWPLGIRGGRHKVYGYENDPVRLFDPHNLTAITSHIAGGTFGPIAGDVRTFGKSDGLTFDAHKVINNIDLLNMVKRIRSDLGLNATPAQPAAPTRKTYTVKPGDSLSLIAKSTYGDAMAWPRIYEANKTVIGLNPDRIFPGQMLVLP